MTTLEALVSISQTLLRANDRWCENPALRKDIMDTVFDASRLFRDENISEIRTLAVRELKIRAGAWIKPIDPAAVRTARRVASSF